MRQADKVIYPDNSLKKGYFAVFAEIFDEVYSSRWLTVQLFKRDFLGAYKQSFVGVFWAFIMPVISVFIFVALKMSGVFSSGDVDMPYVLYATTGIVFWNIFAVGILSSRNSLTNVGRMITKISFPKKCLVFASLGKTMVSFFVQILLLSLMMAFFRVGPGVSAVLVPFVLIPLLFFTLGVSLLTALMNSIFRDIDTILPMMMSFLMFLTPVLYVKPSSGVLALITKYNPMYYYVSAVRGLMFGGGIPEMQGFILTAVFSFLLFVFCLLVFHLAETRLAERV